jgi:hypothetical protein
MSEYYLDMLGASEDIRVNLLLDHSLQAQKNEDLQGLLYHTLKAFI